jgi:hypothetical protein
MFGTWDLLKRIYGILANYKRNWEDYREEQEAFTFETHKTWARMIVLQQYFSWIVD